jgi:hypothetical protein
MACRPVALAFFSASSLLCNSALDTDKTFFIVASNFSRSVIGNIILSMRDPYCEAWLKVERANHHIDDLERNLRAFNTIDTYAIHTEFDPDAGCDLLKLESTKTVAEGLILIIGDALHNLRNALDYLMGAVCTKTDGFGKFPIYETRDKLEIAVNGGLKQKTTQTVIHRIVNDIQPYGGGDGDILWHLHQLNIVDKHQLLIAKTQITLITGIRAIDEDGTEFVIPQWLIVAPHIASHKCVGHRNIKITHNGKATCGISFGKGMPLEGALILPTLRQMAIHVQLVINIMRATI